MVLDSMSFEYFEYLVHRVNITGPRSSGIVADVICGHSGCGLLSTSGTIIMSFHPHRSRHAVVSVTVHGQSFQTH